MQLKLLDADTGLIGDPEEWKRVETEEEAAETILALEELVDRINVVINFHRARFSMAMEAAGATLKELNGYTVKLIPQRSYEYDTALLTELYRHLPKDRVEAALQPTFKVNKLELNKLQKLGGPVRDIIEAAVREIPKAPRVEIKRTLTSGN